MKVDELRVLEADELGLRLRSARRELYELRFKHAVGQLENSSQISKVRHDIARIMTVLRERDFGIVASAPEEIQATAVAQLDEPEAEGPAPEDEAEAEAAQAPARPKRGRSKKTEESR